MLHNHSTQSPTPQTEGHLEQVGSLGGLGLCEMRLEALGSGDRSDPSHRWITFGIDSAACKTVVPSEHPAARGYRTHSDRLTGSKYSTASKATVTDEGQRILCAKGVGGSPMVLNTRKVNCRRPLMSVSAMCEAGNWVVFGPDGTGFAYHEKQATGFILTKPQEDGISLLH